jgi:hypothetical protein
MSQNPLAPYLAVKAKLDAAFTAAQEEIQQISNGELWLVNYQISSITGSSAGTGVDRVVVTDTELHLAGGRVEVTL